MRFARSMILALVLLRAERLDPGPGRPRQRRGPAHCRRDPSLPYTGASPGLSAWAAGGLLAVGGLLLLATRRRPGSAAA